jgi:hypothetical protein
MKIPNTDILFSEFKITDDVINTKWHRMTPKNIKEDIDDIYCCMREKPHEALERLLVLKRKHDSVPVLNNYLCCAYSIIGDIKNAALIAEENYEKFPKYLFAKTSLAQICLSKGELNRIPRIFEDKFDIKSLYPHRKEFHISEFLGFMSVMAIYFYKTGKDDIARNYFQLMKRIDRSHPQTQQTKRTIYPSFIFRILRKISGTKIFNEIEKEAVEEFSAGEQGRSGSVKK